MKIIKTKPQRYVWLTACTRERYQAKMCTHVSMWKCTYTVVSSNNPQRKERSGDFISCNSQILFTVYTCSVSGQPCADTFRFLPVFAAYLSSFCTRSEKRPSEASDFLAAVIACWRWSLSGAATGVRPTPGTEAKPNVSAWFVYTNELTSQSKQ